MLLRVVARFACTLRARALSNLTAIIWRRDGGGVRRKLWLENRPKTQYPGGTCSKYRKIFRLNVSAIIIFLSFNNGSPTTCASAISSGRLRFASVCPRTRNAAIFELYYNVIVIARPETKSCSTRPQGRVFGFFFDPKQLFWSTVHFQYATVIRFSI
jgi:hypothetical protein